MAGKLSTKEKEAQAEVAEAKALRKAKKKAKDEHDLAVQTNIKVGQDFLKSLKNYSNRKSALKSGKANLKWQWQTERAEDNLNRAMDSRETALTYRQLTTATNDVISSQKATLAHNGLYGRSALQMENDTMQKAESSIINTHESAYYRGIIADMEMSVKEHTYLAGMAGVSAQKGQLRTELMMSALGSLSNLSL